MGYPRAKSLDCVQKMANRPALDRSIGLVTSSVKTSTTTNTVSFEIRIDSRKVQLTRLKKKHNKNHRYFVYL